jgi:hypothetical protein
LKGFAQLVRWQGQDNLVLGSWQVL